MLSVALVLFLIMDPIGSLAYYIPLVKDISPGRRKKVVLREMLIALAVMLFFNFLGESIFELLALTETTVRISSGVILFLIAVKILFTSPDNPRANLPAGEPFIFPLAIPLIAGPALMATIMLYAHMESSPFIVIGAILLAWAFSSLIIFFADSVKSILGESGLIACERLIGMVLVILGVQRVLEGVLLFWTTHPKPL